MITVIARNVRTGRQIESQDVINGWCLRAGHRGFSYVVAVSEECVREKDARPPRRLALALAHRVCVRVFSCQKQSA